jgi:3-hydroxyethyl bacteriochlorophyllide a dehydrogenase
MSRSLAVVVEEPERLALREVDLDAPTDGDVVVETEFSGVSTGTERLFFNGKMPPFPGMGYPLIPGYETVGRVIAAGPGVATPIGSRVFVPGARCFGPVRGLHGGAAARLVAPADKVVGVPAELGDKAVLLALAATALHAFEAATAPADAGPLLIVGHGVLGRLLARIAAQARADVAVWETSAARRAGAEGYRVLAPEDDARRDYRTIYDVSGDAGAIDSLVQRLARGGEIVLAGFYDRIGFAFPPAFMREARFRIAAQWGDGDLARAGRLVETGALSLENLITHRRPAAEATEAYPQAFGDPQCLKMVLDWRGHA